MSMNKKLLFNKTNYTIMGVGVVLIIIGFFLMAGGGNELGPDGYSHEFNKDIYSFRRIKLAPVVIMIGFIMQVVAIMKSFKINK